MIYRVIGFAGFLTFQSALFAQSAYKIMGNCDGLPRIDVSTPAGVCVGLAATGLKFPRTVTELSDGSMMVVDMGGWGEKLGSVWRLTRNADGKTFDKSSVMKGIDRPHGGALDPSGKYFYVGEIAAVFRFDPFALKPSQTIVDVATNLPFEGRHPLTAIAFGKDNALYVNRGSVSDNCEGTNGEKPNPNSPCAEAEGKNGRGVIRKYVFSIPDGLPTDFSILANGLRNSMALAVHPVSGALLQGENARDSIDRADKNIDDKTEPREELNFIEQGGHYGWPYCYNDSTASPEFPKADCSKFKKPALLMPAHIAPLGMAYYTGNKFPSWYKNKVIVGWHGYREYGQKLVAYETDAKGKPFGPPYEIINNWSKKGDQPMGAPVGVTIAKDGSIWIAEDKNGTILRVSYNGSEGAGIPTAGVTVNGGVDAGADARCKDMATRNDLFTQIERNIIDPLCTNCHGAATGNAGTTRLAKCDDIGNAKRLLTALPGHAPLVVPNNLSSQLYLQVEGKTPGLSPMPAGGIAPEQLKMVADWINAGAPIPATKVVSGGKAIAKIVTWLKKRPVDSSLLSDGINCAAGAPCIKEKCQVKANSSLGYSSMQMVEGGHAKLNVEANLPNASCKDFTGTVYVFATHFNFQPK